MSRDGSRRPEIEIRTEWVRFGVVVAVAWVVFVGIVVYFLQRNPVVGIAVAVVGSVVAGAVVTILALYRPGGETLVERWFGRDDE